MEIIGRYQIKPMPQDDRVFVCKCPNPNCCAILRFTGSEILKVTPEQTYHIGEFNKRITDHHDPYYAVKCKGCEKEIFLSFDERHLLDYLESKRVYKKELKKYEKENPSLYDFGL